MLFPLQKRSLFAQKICAWSHPYSLGTLIIDMFPFINLIATYDVVLETSLVLENFDDLMTATDICIPI